MNIETEKLYIILLSFISIYLLFRNLYLERLLEAAKGIIEEVDDFFEKLVKKTKELETKKKEDDE